MEVLAAGTALGDGKAPIDFVPAEFGQNRGASQWHKCQLTVSGGEPASLFPADGADLRDFEDSCVVFAERLAFQKGDFVTALGMLIQALLLPSDKTEAEKFWSALVAADLEEPMRLGGDGAGPLFFEVPASDPTDREQQLMREERTNRMVH